MRHNRPEWKITEEHREVALAVFNELLDLRRGVQLRHLGVSADWSFATVHRGLRLLKHAGAVWYNVAGRVWEVIDDGPLPVWVLPRLELERRALMSVQDDVLLDHNESMLRVTSEIM